MGVPQRTLESWSAQGATVASAATYKSIQAALFQYEWPPDMTYEVYLQGSYPNHTNIRGDSDVDVAVQSSAVFYSNLSEEEKRALNLGPGGFTFADFRNHVSAALGAYYGHGLIRSGRKSLKVAAASNRLPADVVPCICYRKYRALSVVAEGMTFWTTDGKQIINYPKLHLDNGHSKNSRCDDAYKPTVRMFKNARNALSGFTNSPSYFLECLLYNIEDDCYGNDFKQTFDACRHELQWLAQNSGLANMTTGSEQDPLFGASETQWDIESARGLIDGLCSL